MLQLPTSSSNIPKPSSRASAAMTSALRWPMTNSAWRIPGVFEAWGMTDLVATHPSFIHGRHENSIIQTPSTSTNQIQLADLPTSPPAAASLSTGGPQGTAAGCWTIAGWQRTRRCWPKFVTSTPWERLDNHSATMGDPLG